MSDFYLQLNKIYKPIIESVDEGNQEHSCKQSMVDGNPLTHLRCVKWLDNLFIWWTVFAIP